MTSQEMIFNDLWVPILLSGYYTDIQPFGTLTTILDEIDVDGFGG